MLLRPFVAVLEREVLKLLRQRGRLLSAMVRPLLWLLVIGAGLSAVQGKHGESGYQTFLVPGVLGMTLLFGGMLAALATVYDKESGVMRMLVIAPIEHYWIVLAKALGATASALLQALLLLRDPGTARVPEPTDIDSPAGRGLLGTALACSSLGMLVAAWSRTLDNYATMMNLVIFPVFFPLRLPLPGAAPAGRAALRRHTEPLHVRRRFAQARGNRGCGRVLQGGL